MTDSTRPAHRRLSALIALAAMALCASLAPGSAAAAPADGTAVLELQAGKATSDLLAQDVRLSYKAKQGKTGSAKRPFARAGGSKAADTLRLPIDSIAFGKVVELGVEGNLVFAHGKRKVTIRDIELRVAAKRTSLAGRVGKRNLVLFRAQGESKLVANTVALSDAPFALTGKAADALAPRLGLDSIKPGQLGQLSLNAVQNDLPKEEPKKTEPVKVDDGGLEPIIDPYSAQCPLPATSEASGTAAPAAPETVLPGALGVSEGMIGWGFKQSFRTYLVTAAGGSATGIAPATVLSPPPGPPQAGTFEFPAGSGEYLANTPSAGDDQAVIDGEGEVVLCAFHEGKGGFRITLSNPTVTIDGVSSRLTVDVSTNLAGVVRPAQRVDLATIEPVNATYASSPETVTWSNMPTKLTQAGLEATGLEKFYVAGTALDPLTVEIDEPWPFTAACDLSGIEPMPIPTVTGSWPAAPSGIPALPTLTSPDSVVSGGVNWGVRNALRGTINGTGVFNLSGGATSSHPVNTTPKQMSGEGKFFTWPAVSGQYEEPALPAEPGRLILEGTGTVGLCQTHAAQAYGTVLSNPTLVIDGANSRLVMDVSTIFRTSWTSFDSIDVASLAIGSVEKTVTAGPGPNQETITWTFPDLGTNGTVGGGDDDKDSANSAVKLTANGASGLWLLGNFGAQPSPYRTAGTGLNKVSVSIVHSTI